jgi:hypothetical protein
MAFSDRFGGEKECILRVVFVGHAAHLERYALERYTADGVGDGRVEEWESAGG